ncbi:MAG: hypothetical protein IAE80_19335 [Anaerolinea sp.]|nr:hypothetical protein [Anaerolinea sp.]
MSGEALVLSILILALGTLYLALPFIRGGKVKENSEQARERLKLVAAYERALMTVRDLDEDYQVGKLSQETYAAERARWTEHGAMLLEMIEQKNGEGKKSSKRSKPAPETASAADDDAVEQAIAAYVRARENVR